MCCKCNLRGNSDSVTVSRIYEAISCDAKYRLSYQNAIDLIMKENVISVISKGVFFSSRILSSGNEHMNPVANRADYSTPCGGFHDFTHNKNIGWYFFFQFTLSIIFIAFGWDEDEKRSKKNDFWLFNVHLIKEIMNEWARGNEQEF